jgi:hypothetical protein
MAGSSVVALLLVAIPPATFACDRARRGRPSARPLPGGTAEANAEVAKAS